MEVIVIGKMDHTMDNTFESANRVYGISGLCPTIPTCSGGGIQPKILTKEYIGGVYTQTSKDFFRGMLPKMSRTLKANSNDAGVVERYCVALRGRNPENPADRSNGSETEQRLEVNMDNIANCVTTVSKDCMVLEKYEKNMGLH